MVRPNSVGSTNWPVIVSSTRNRVAVQRNVDQPGSIAAARMIGKACREHGADIGQKAQQHREKTPEQKVGDPDEPQARAEKETERRIDGSLREEISRQPKASIVQGDRGSPYVTRAQ